MLVVGGGFSLVGGGSGVGGDTLSVAVLGHVVGGQDGAAIVAVSAVVLLVKIAVAAVVVATSLVDETGRFVVAAISVPSAHPVVEGGVSLEAVVESVLGPSGQTTFVVPVIIRSQFIGVLIVLVVRTVGHLVAFGTTIRSGVVEVTTTVASKPLRVNGGVTVNLISRVLTFFSFVLSRSLVLVVP